MRTDKYFSVSEGVAKQCALEQVRFQIAGNRYILSESDIRNSVTAGRIQPSDFATLDIHEISSEDADRLIAENGKCLGGNKLASNRKQTKSKEE